MLVAQEKYLKEELLELQQGELDNLPAYKPKKKKRSSLKGKLMLVLFFSAIGVYIIHQHVNISEQQQALQKLQDKLNDYTADNEKMRVDIAVDNTVNSVEKIAKEKYGMQSPDGDQYVKVTLIHPHKNLNTAKSK